VCTICPDGSECDGANKSTCAGGALCPEGTGTAGTCPDYQDCTNWSSPCGAGKTLSGGSCVNCPIDVTCLLRGETTTAVTTGYYSPTGVNVEYICPGGKDCTNADSITDCLTGYYSAEGTLACTECLAPYACPHPELGLSQ
jgi:hypothetical protein